MIITAPNSISFMKLQLTKADPTNLFFGETNQIKMGLVVDLFSYQEQVVLFFNIDMADQNLEFPNAYQPLIIGF